MIDNGRKVVVMVNMMDRADVGFFIVATTALIVVLFVKWRLKRYVLLWRGTLISYIIFIAVLYAPLPRFCTAALKTILPVIVLGPAMLIYGMLPGTIKPCPSVFDKFAIYTIGFLFYALVFFGIMKVIRQRKEAKAPDVKRDDNLKKQPRSEPDLKGG